jgi:hypothetical protein
VCGRPARGPSGREAVTPGISQATALLRLRVFAAHARDDVDEGAALALRPRRPAGGPHACCMCTETAARGQAGPASRPPRLSLARHNRCAEPPKPRLGPQRATIRWSCACTARGRHDGVVLWSTGTRECLCRLRFKIAVATFEIAYLKKVSTYSKISKTKSCRGAIDQQLLQKATYVWINGFGKIVLNFSKISALKLLCPARSSRVYTALHSKLECPPIRKNVFPKIMKNFYIGRF